MCVDPARHPPQWTSCFGRPSDDRPPPTSYGGAWLDVRASDGLLREVLADIDDGVPSPLELHYRRDVERCHRLPPGARNEVEVQRLGGRWYRDVRYSAWYVIVELDGREAHPAEGAFRDMGRDNVAVADGDVVLRYGWRDIVGDPCGVAAQVGVVLALHGWTGRPQPCSASCTADRAG